ncbi:vacuolar protein sorting-associated protein 41 homolog [Trichonephila clavipes]|uniref:Vacuolar protein sorting-associated protein 41 homolog n=1 Tax=Trichonephila clavipes TaxID=2585209 RepID=A0A8X6V8M0_TRICX|nr:vacuolar protein sorting-associated protein 41 homolog [Trichonephila clavipes]
MLLTSFLDTVHMIGTNPCFPLSVFKLNSLRAAISFSPNAEIIWIVPSPSPQPLPIKSSPSIFNTDFFICGISSFGAALVVLTVAKTDDPVSIGSRPQFRVLETHGEEYSLILSDILTLRGYQEYRCNDYHLDSLADEGLYFILSLKDFVVAKPRNEDDHIKWLLEHERFKEAVEAVSQAKDLKVYKLLIWLGRIDIKDEMSCTSIINQAILLTCWYRTSFIAYSNSGVIVTWPYRIQSLVSIPLIY